MQNLTVRLLIVFVVSAILKTLSHMIFGWGFWGIGIGVLIDIAVLGYVYVVLQEYRFFNIKKIMAVLGSLTFLSILIDVGILRGDVGSLLILIIIVWVLIGRGGFFSGNRRRYR